jgi:ribosomal protein S27AE
MAREAREIREPPWMCGGCGYVMDAATPVQGAGQPQDGSLAICANCGALHVRHGTRWLPITPDEYAAIDPRQRAELARIEAIRRGAIRSSLAGKRGNDA